MKATLLKLKDHVVHLVELLIVFFSPAAAQLGVVVLAVLVDTATGYWAAKRCGEETNSKKLYPVVPKLIVYIGLVLLCHGIQVVFEVPHARTMAAIGLTVLELISIDENFKKVKGVGILGPILKLMSREKNQDQKKK